MRLTPYPILAIICVLSLSGCGGDKGMAPSSSSTPSPSSSSSATSGTSGGDGPSISRMNRDPTPGKNFLNVSGFPFYLIASGGVERDGIPALTDPKFVDPSSADADYLSDEDLVLGVAINGEARAYPHNIGWWHEIVNDVVGGQPISVSLCPLTSTGMVFSALDDDRRIELGVSGLLFNNNLIMYDRREGETLFPQMTYVGLKGSLEGQALELLPVVEAKWGYWKQLYPNTQVVSGETGIYMKDQYFWYPYDRPEDYRAADEFIFFELEPPMSSNGTATLFRAKQMTLGVRFGEIAMAYPFPAMGEQAVINHTVGDNPLVVVWYAQAEMAVPYFRKVGERTLTFEKVASNLQSYPFMMKDRETGTLWNLKGEAISGELRDSKLEQAPSHNAFWFAWTIWQNTGIY